MLAKCALREVHRCWCRYCWVEAGKVRGGGIDVGGGRASVHVLWGICGF